MTIDGIREDQLAAVAAGNEQRTERRRTHYAEQAELVRLRQMEHGDYTRIIAENHRLREALGNIEAWTMHSGTLKYQQGEYDPAGYYNNAYYLIEAEVSKARDIARATLGPISLSEQAAAQREIIKGKL